MLLPAADCHVQDSVMAQQIPTYYTRKEAAEARRVNIRTIDNLIKDGKLRAVRLSTRRIGIRLEDLLALDSAES
jgi:excisionase family DNA binding protein